LNRYARNCEILGTNLKSGGSFLATTQQEEILLSLVIPCYNEEGNVRDLFARASKLVASESRAEVIFVNNGSSDSTGALLSELCKGQPRTRVVTVKQNKGYGHGIKRGLETSTGQIVGWTHADLQTDPLDALTGLERAQHFNEPVFIKGLRRNRPLTDTVFTMGMSVFETLLFRIRLRDINAQPTLFSRKLLASILEGPDDFSLDLFALVNASEARYIQVRFPVKFGPRFSGTSKWNTSAAAKIRFIRRTIAFSLALARKRLMK
jgi:glycosyltransferase involved in cell wall biosynthesis